MLDETNDYALLSSMSPKVDKTKKKLTKKKGPSKLAVRSAFRRSSIYDHLPSTVTNKNLHIVDGSTENSSETGSSSSKSDSVPKSYIDNLKNKKLLSESKISNIQQWIEEVKPETEQNDQNISIFSTVSSIHGEYRTDVKTGGAVNSTFAVGVQQKRFDDLFEKVIAGTQKKKQASLKMDKHVLNVEKKETTGKGDKNKNHDIINSLMSKYLDPAVESDENDDSFQNLQNDHKKNYSFENKVIDDSLTNDIVNSDDSYNGTVNIKLDADLKRDTFVGKVKIEDNFINRDNKVKNYINEKYIKKCPNMDNNRIEKSDVIIIDDSFEENKENVNGNGFGSPIIEEECLNLLDKLYGDKWRKNQDQVLPKSEPRFKKTKERNDVITAKTEIKPKIKNPYLDSEKKRSRNLIGILDSARRKVALESPWLSRLKNLCDSDSESNPDSEPNGLQRVQLNFEGTTPLNNCKKSENSYLPQTRLQYDEDFNKKSDKKIKSSTKEGSKIKFNNNTKDSVKKINSNSIHSKTEYRKRIDSSSSDEKYHSCTDLDIGISLADKIKGNKNSTKKLTDLSKNKVDRHFDKGRKCSTSSSDSTDDSIKFIRKDKTKGCTKNATNVPKSKVERCHDKERISNTSNSDSTDDFTKIINKDKTKESKTRKNVDHIKTKQRTDSSSSSDSLEGKISDFDNIFKRFNINDKNTHKTSATSKPLSFLASLSKNIPPEQCDASAKIFKACYKKNRQQLVEKLFKMYNENIFDNAMPSDMDIEWSERLVGTAGYCACKKITRRTGKIERTARLVLSSKVLDSADRLRDTLVHELCHAATYLVNEVADGHGPYWKAWAAKAMRTYPELPPIKRCHDYALNTKYTYRCSNCGYSFGRHSKSVDLNTKRCGYCRGTLEVFLNTVTKNGEKKTVATPKKEPTGFALFVKENYALNKAPDLKHADVMKILSKKFQETKIKNS